MITRLPAAGIEPPSRTGYPSRVPGEFSRIAQFVAPFEPPSSPAGPGDDCAVVQVRKGHELCVTVDAVVEDVHFTRAHFSPADIGHKALAVNLSDLASMGATPRFGLCALALPEWVERKALRGISRGMSALAKSAGLSLVGGNLSRARELSVTITVAGEVPRGRALRRDSARAGDWLYVGGTLGDAAAGLHLMQHPPKRALTRPMRSLLLAQRRPQPQLELGVLALAYASAAIDLSDGLAADVAHVAMASGLRAILEQDLLPLSPTLLRGVGEGWLPADAPAWALDGGEDYRLLLAIPPRRAAAFERALALAGLEATRIGSLEAGRGVRVRGSDGKLRLPRRAGFDHFRARD